MIYKISPANIESLLKLPETGMGYQLIQAAIIPDYQQREFIVLNGIIAIDIYTIQNQHTIKDILGNDLQIILNTAREVHLNIFDPVHENRITGSFVKEGTAFKKGAKNGDKEIANGDELFVRLSAFENDKRIDKKNNRLLPGSYTTTASDALRCKTQNENPVERYALPNELMIKWVFNIQPVLKDTLQRGWVQPDFGKKGGGREVYFENGTSNSTFITQNKWQYEYTSVIS